MFYLKVIYLYQKFLQSSVSQKKEKHQNLYVKKKSEKISKKGSKKMVFMLKYDSKAL
jgi:hypothetical protein